MSARSAAPGSILRDVRVSEFTVVGELATLESGYVDTLSKSVSSTTCTTETLALQVGVLFSV